MLYGVNVGLTYDMYDFANYSKYSIQLRLTYSIYRVLCFIDLTYLEINIYTRLDL